MLISDFSATSPSSTLCVKDICWPVQKTIELFCTGVYAPNTRTRAVFFSNIKLSGSILSTHCLLKCSIFPVYKVRLQDRG